MANKKVDKKEKSKEVPLKYKSAPGLPSNVQVNIARRRRILLS